METQYHHPYQCPTCGKSFYQKWNYTAHMRVHTGERPYTCSLCDKSFKQKCSLTEHLRVHTGERPYMCSICDKSYIQRSALARHIKSHSDETPHKCFWCYKAYKYRHHLKRHLKVHTSQHLYASPLCKKSITNISSQENQVRSDVYEAKSPHEISSRCDLSTPQNQEVRDEDLTTSRLESNETQLSGLHFSKSPYTMNIKLEEDT